MVTRYVCIEGYNLDDKYGDWVRYNEYAALQAENERLKAERVDLERYRNDLVLAINESKCLAAGGLYSWYELYDSLDARLSDLIDAHKDG